MKQRVGLNAPFAYAASMNGLAVAAANNHDHYDDDDNDSSSPTSTIVPPSPVTSRRASLVPEKSTTNNTTLPDTASTENNSNNDNDNDTAEETEEDTTTSTSTSSRPSKLHPRVAVILGVDRKWYLPLVVCRALSVVPALWWGLRCAFTFLAELLRIRPGMWREGWVAIIVGSAAADWDVERRFRVTEVALAIMWVCIPIIH
jgi:hypothetical protein